MAKLFHPRARIGKLCERIAFASDETEAQQLKAEALAELAHSRYDRLTPALMAELHEQIELAMQEFAQLNG